MNQTIKKIFIANRGEIARRIGITAKRLGIEVVSPVFGKPPEYLTSCISEFAQIEQDLPAVFLDADKMIQLALKHKCDAIHPGFGFLSENETFAKKCLDNGLNWIGPAPETIAQMASKAVARNHAIKANVPCIEGLDGINILDPNSPDLTKLDQFADRVGFPLLLKAALGGGGKGMRVAKSKEELRTLSQRASSEALASFGDSELICERYLENPRHIEVQILGDKHGNVYVVGDRDCSIQRRHQKIVEESPAPFLDDALRKAIHQAALELAQQVSYQSAGTVEFLVDPGQQNPSKAFFFLEMNTRLQVEHPATEEAFCIDLVEKQIEVAQGKEISLSAEDLTAKRHAIELRIYSEDPENNFLPAPGVIANFIPDLAPGVRWEIGIDQSDEVTGRFDPMVAKIIGFASTRTGAINNLIHGIQSSVFAGPKNNLKYLVAILKHPAFQREISTTKYIEKYHERHLESLAKHPDQQQANAIIDSLDGRPSGIMTSSQNSQHSENFLKAFGSEHVSSTSQSTTLSMTKKFQRRFLDYRIDYFTGTRLLDNRDFPIKFSLTRLRGADVEITWVHVNGYDAIKQVNTSEPEFKASSASSQSRLDAPVPGKIIAINKSADEIVNEGEVIMVLESMKMEFEIKSPKSDTIAKVLVSTGNQVSAGDALIQWSNSQNE